MFGVKLEELVTELKQKSYEATINCQLAHFYQSSRN